MTTRFRYQAVGSLGRQERGSAEATTLEALAGSLADRWLILLDAESDAASDGRPVSSVTRSSTSGRQSLVRLDSLGRMTVARPAGLDSVRYQYEAQGRLSQITDGGRIVSCRCLARCPQGT